MSFVRPKRWLQKAAKEKLQRCAQASSRRGRRSTPSQPAQSLPCSGLVGCSLSCARARHAEAVRSGRRQRRRVGRMLGHRAGRGERIRSVWARSRAVPWCAVPCASRPSHGTLARVRPCACVRSMWSALGEGEPSRGAEVLPRDGYRSRASGGPSGRTLLLNLLSPGLKNGKPREASEGSRTSELREL